MVKAPLAPPKVGMIKLLPSVTKVEVEAETDPFFLLQETRVRAGELDQAAGRPFTLNISNQYGEDEVTHSLQTESRAALQSWMEALWQLFFDMSKGAGVNLLKGLWFTVFTKGFYLENM